MQKKKWDASIPLLSPLLPVLATDIHRLTVDERLFKWGLSACLMAAPRAPPSGRECRQKAHEGEYDKLYCRLGQPVEFDTNAIFS